MQGANLVGNVPVQGDTVGRADELVNQALAHQVRRHAVGDQLDRDAHLYGALGGQAGALQVRPRLGRNQRHLLALLPGNPQHPAQRGAGQAVGQDAIAVAQERGCVRAASLADLIAAFNFAIHIIQDGGLWTFACGHRRLCALQRLRHDGVQIIGRRPRREQALAGLAQIVQARPGHRQTETRGVGQRWAALHHHLLDGLRRLFHRATGDIRRAEWIGAAVEQHHSLLFAIKTQGVEAVGQQGRARGNGERSLCIHRRLRQHYPAGASAAAKRGSSV